MVLGSVFYIISFILIGPQSLIGLPKTIWVVCIGMVILGFGATLTVLPIIPEFISLCEEVYQDEKIAVGDLSSGMFDSSYLVGSLFGPIIAGYLTNALGFENSSSIFALMLFGYSLFYCVFGGILEELRNGSKKKENTLLDGSQVKEQKDLLLNAKLVKEQGENRI